MPHFSFRRLFPLILWVVCSMVAAVPAATYGQQCGGCLEQTCLSCGPLATDRFIDPYGLSFCDRPAACIGTASLDLVALERNGGHSQDILFAGLNSVANVSDLNFVTELGFRLDLYLPGNCGTDFNLNVFRSGHDLAQLTRSDVGVTFDFFGGVPLAPATSYTLDYSADLFSIEANLRSQPWPRMAPSFGFRFLSLEEEFNIWESGTNTGVFSDTTNHLYGMQIGGQAMLWQRNCLRLESTYKIGVYYNDLDIEASASNANLQGDFGQVAFVGELQLMLIYQIGPRLMLRTGYQGLWLNGVAKAPDQSDNGSFATGLLSPDTGTVNYQGGFLGLEVTW